MNRDNRSMIAWTKKFLASSTLSEDTYHEAICAASRLEQSGRVTFAQWLFMIKEANKRLL